MDIIEILENYIEVVTIHDDCDVDEVIEYIDRDNFYTINEEIEKKKRQELIDFALLSYGEPYGAVTLKKVAEKVDKFLENR